jgi:FixJ family two-component response regulator
MPQMSGMEVARRVREKRPGLPVLFMSGYTDRTLQETEQLPADVDVMQKPFTSTVLATRVRRALDNGRPDVKRKTTSR